MNKEHQIIDFEVPNLKVLHAEKIIERIDYIFFYKKNSLIKKYPILNEFSEEMIPIYISYFAIYKNYIENGDEDTLSFAESLRDDVKLYKLIEETIPELAVYLSYLKMNENSYQEKYEEYKNEIKDRYKKDQKAISFMNSVYNGNVNNALYNYFLSYGPPSFEKIDLNLDDDETKKLCEYLFYKILFSNYKTICGLNPIYRIKFKNAFKNMEPESLNNLAYVYLSSVDEDLLTFDEFSEYINIRKQMTRELIDFSRIQFEDYESLVKCRRKNN